MKLTDLWFRMEQTFGAGYAQSVAHDQVIPGLGGRTVDEALAAGEEVADVWRAVVASFPDRVPTRLR